MLILVLCPVYKECEIFCSNCWGCVWVLSCNSYNILVIMFGSNRLPNTTVGWVCLDMNCSLLRLSGKEWEDVLWFGMEMKCKVLAWNLLGESEENTSTWHLGYLTFGLRFESSTCTEHKHGIQCWGYVCMKLQLHLLSHLCVCVCVFCVVFVICVCVLFCEFLRYPELQQTLSMYLFVSNITILMSVNTSNPVTAM